MIWVKEKQARQNCAQTSAPSFTHCIYTHRSFLDANFIYFLPQVNKTTTLTAAHIINILYIDFIIILDDENNKKVKNTCEIIVIIIIFNTHTHTDLNNILCAKEKSARIPTRIFSYFPPHSWQSKLSYSRLGMNKKDCNRSWRKLQAFMP